MNIEQAKSIALSSILRAINYEPAKKNGNDLTYYSPFRIERTPSLHVNAQKNVWFDFGEGIGGDLVAFVRAYLKSHNEDHTCSDALRWLSNMQPLTLPVKIIPDEMEDDEEVVLELISATPIKSAAFFNLLQSRCIPIVCGEKYLKEVKVRNHKSGTEFSALGFANMDGGYELRNQFFKGCLGGRNISFIRGSTVLPEEVHVFEGMFDFFSALLHEKKIQLDGDAIILHSTTSLKRAFPFINRYSYKTVYDWLDNDVAGEKARLSLKEFVASARTEKNEPIEFKSQAEIYAGHKDVNQWLIHEKKRAPCP